MKFLQNSPSRLLLYDFLWLKHLCEVAFYHHYLKIHFDIV